LEDGPKIALIELATEAVVPNLTDAAFQKHAEAAKKGCPVSKALTGPRIELKAKLLP
jgi:lipoyl-dependent peroxiredoxin